MLLTTSPRSSIHETYLSPLSASMNLLSYLAFWGPGITSAKCPARIGCTFSVFFTRGNHRTGNQSPWSGEPCAATSQVSHPAECTVGKQMTDVLGVASPRPTQGWGTKHQPTAEHVSSRARECDGGWHSWGSCCRWHCLPMLIGLTVSDWETCWIHSSRCPLPKPPPF